MYIYIYIFVFIKKLIQCWNAASVHIIRNIQLHCRITCIIYSSNTSCANDEWRSNLYCKVASNKMNMTYQIIRIPSPTPTKFIVYL